MPATCAVSTSSAGEVGFGNVTDACKTQNEICFMVSLFHKESKISIQEKKNWSNVETKLVEKIQNIHLQQLHYCNMYVQQ